MNDVAVYRAGDVVILNLDPALGTEQAGRRPALVISNALMHEVSKRMIVCPITKNMTPWPTKVSIPGGFKTRGMILADQVRFLDHEARVLRHVETLPIDIVTLMRSYVGRLLDLEVSASG
ncbi:transcriptional modulator of MazE/toxin, MazF [Rhizobium sp. RU20A]|uniref:type II toxin-antitoxin system PemK/MazF family toxin n=1 Tax=Rhizobium sp. RU20A TaxID=1907412 RepID=UPI000953CABF|nr:type II toxin-antitoxin system PemK/MazF family toxin [Rhizobium sp. RU20A]SIQ17927.1 transcriptional modulator of MazE/toxin, MazF [Rhizobium sp. RU20A]